MGIKSLTAPVSAFAMAFLLSAAAPGAHAAQNHGDRHPYVLEDEIRHQLVMLPYYSFFDWLEAQVQADGTTRTISARK